MPEFTEHERTELHAKVRQQIRFVTQTCSLDAASNRRFLVMGIIQGMCMAGALTVEQYTNLVAELQTTTHCQIEELFMQTLRDTHAPGYT